VVSLREMRNLSAVNPNSLYIRRMGD